MIALFATAEARGAQPSAGPDRNGQEEFHFSAAGYSLDTGAPQADKKGIIVTPNGERMLNADDYHQHLRIILKIFRKFRPRDYVYVFVGRHPTVLETLTRIFFRKSGVAFTLPMGNVGTAVKLTDATKEELFTHFDKHRPSAEALKGKRILLIDTGSGGMKTLVKTYELATEYFSSRKIRNEVDVLGLLYQRAHPEAKKRNLAKIPRVTIFSLLNHKTLVNALKGKKFTPVARHGRCDVCQPPTSPMEDQPQNKVLEKGLLYFATKDPLLPHRLAQSAGKNDFAPHPETLGKSVKKLRSRGK